MKLSREKIDICRARKCFTIADLAGAYGVSRARMHTLLNQREVSAITAGKLAKALGVEVTEIIE